MNHDQISPELLPTVLYADQPVITTELMAMFYATEKDNVWQNFKRNQERFVEGKHFYKLTGAELKAFRRQIEDAMDESLRLTTCQVQISPKTRELNLWTARGAARHAKMLNTARLGKYLKGWKTLISTAPH